MPGKPVLPLSALARVARGMLLTSAGLALLNVFATLDNFQNDGFPRRQLFVRAAVLVGATVLTAAAWLPWQSRMNKQLREVGIEGMKFTPSSSVWWWFVPFANLSMPPRAVEELWKASDPASGKASWQSVPAPWILWAWWILFVLAGFLDRFGFNAEDPDVSLLLSLGSSLAAVPAAVFAVILVSSIDRRVAQKRGTAVAVTAVDSPPRRADLIIAGALALVVFGATVVGGVLGPARRAASDIARSGNDQRASGRVDPSQLEGRVVFNRSEDGDLELFTMNADGTQVRQITSNEVHDVLPSWSPDGRRVAFTRLDPSGDASDIYIVQADGSGERNITNSPEREIGSSWSGDGRLILFSVGDESSQDLYIMSPDGSDRRKVGSGSFIKSAVWAHERTFVYTDGTPENSDVLFAGVDGGSEVLVGGPTNDYYAAFSAARSRTAFVRGDGEFGELMVIIGGAAPKSIARGKQLRSPTWSPDGTLILYSADSLFWVIDPTRGGPTPLETSRTGSDASWTS